jgi:hypothetical protein
MADSDGEQTGIFADLRRWRRTDDLGNLRMRVQRALKTAETVMYAEGVDPKTRLKAARMVVSASREARKTIEAVELEQRVEALEERYAEVNGP